MESILETKKLDLRYGAFQALYGIDTEIFPNEITALIGPSGCGKSTYLKTLNRMNDLVPGCKIDGAVLFHGHNVYGDKIDVTELRSRIGMVFQKPNPFPMSIYDNIAYAPRLHGVRGRAELDEIMDVRKFVGMAPQQAERYITERVRPVLEANRGREAAGREISC